MNKQWDECSHQPWANEWTKEKELLERKKIIKPGNGGNEWKWKIHKRKIEWWWWHGTSHITKQTSDTSSGTHTYYSKELSDFLTLPLASGGGSGILALSLCWFSCVQPKQFAFENNINNTRTYFARAIPPHYIDIGSFSSSGHTHSLAHVSSGYRSNIFVIYGCLFAHVLQFHK